MVTLSVRGPKLTPYSLANAYLEANGNLTDSLDAACADLIRAYDKIDTLEGKVSAGFVRSSPAAAVAPAKAAPPAITLSSEAP